MENWITLFILALLHLLHKTQSGKFNSDVLNLICLKYISPAKETLLKTNNKVVLSAGLAHGAGILKKNVYTWGQDRHSCLGRRPATLVAQADSIPWFLFPKVDVHSIACGRHHTLALTSNGLYSWGLSNYGQLGIHGLKNSPNPRIVETLSEETIVAVAAGQYHSLAISGNGCLWTWGWGVHGQLGHGSIEDVSIPVVVSRLNGEVIVQAAGGYAHSTVLTAKGRVVVFGSSYFGQLGIGSPVKRTVPIEVYGLSEPISQIATGYFHNLALSKAGRLYIWGSSPQVLRSQTQAQKRSKAFTAKSSFKPDEDELSGKFGCDQVSTCENPVNSSKGEFFSETFGAAPVVDPRNPEQNLNLNLNLNLDRDRDFPNCEAPVSPDDCATHLSPMLVDTSNLMGSIVAISCGCHHSLILDEKGTVYSWGKNFDGQLGDGTRKAVLLPTPIQINNQLKLSSDNLILHVPLSTIPIQHICCGADFSLAMEAGGRIWGWGSNQNGQLGTLPAPEDSDIRIKIKANSNKRVLKVPYGSQNNIVDSPQLVPMVAYQHFPAFPENKLSTTVLCPIFLPFETVEHKFMPLAKIQASPNVLSLHYVLECFHNCYNVELVKLACVELENLQALAKIHHLNKSYCSAFTSHLKCLINSNPDSVPISSISIISNSRKVLKAPQNGNLVSLEVVVPNQRADIIVKSKSENYIKSKKMVSSSLEKMNVSETREATVGNGDGDGMNGVNMKMETSDNQTWIQSDDTLEEQSSITSMLNSDVYRSENTSSQYNHLEEVKKLPVSICDNEIYQASSGDSSSFENKDHLDHLSQRSHQCDKSESSSVGILDCVSNEESETTSGPKYESDYEEDSLNRLNILNSLNSEIKDILLGAISQSLGDINYTEVMNQVNHNSLKINENENEKRNQDDKVGQKALDLFQFYLEIVKKASKTEFLYFLHESIVTWISHKLPIGLLETLFESRWDDFVDLLGIIMICGIDGYPDYASTQQMLHQFSLKFNLRVCAWLIESVSDKSDLHPELVKLLANARAAPNVGSRLSDRRSYEDLLAVTLSKLKGEIPLQPFINIEPSILHNEITAFSCGHRFSNSRAIQHVVTKAAAKLEEQSFPHIANQLRELFDKPLVIRKFACPDCIASFFLLRNIST